MSTISVYHFLHVDFGLPFIEQYSKLDRMHTSSVNLTFVLSGKYRSCKKWVAFVKLKMAMMTYFYKIKFSSLKIKICNDVNSDSFKKLIPKDCFAVCTGFNQLFHKDLIQLFCSFVNVHPSILPYYRGPVPSKWCIQNGEKYSGFTLHRITEKIDSGEILFQDFVSIDVNETENSLNTKIVKAATIVFREYINLLVENKTMKKNILAAHQFYTRKVGYKSFN